MPTRVHDARATARACADAGPARRSIEGDARGPSRDAAGDRAAAFGDVEHSAPCGTVALPIARRAASVARRVDDATIARYTGVCPSCFVVASCHGAERRGCRSRRQRPGRRRCDRVSTQRTAAGHACHHPSASRGLPCVHGATTGSVAAVPCPHRQRVRTGHVLHPDPVPSVACDDPAGCGRWQPVRAAALGCVPVPGAYCATLTVHVFAV